MQIEYPDEKQLPRLKELWKLAFGDEGDFVEAFFSHAYASDRCRVTLDGERVAAMLYWLDCEYQGRKSAYLYAVATHPDFRGQGLCRALLEDTHECLAGRGYAAALLYPAGEGLRQMYGKMGYQDFGSVQEFSGIAGTPVSLREVSAGEYALLRRTYLPADGVIQEGENLSFLAATAKLFAGEDFLLAANAEGETLICMELLGREEAAPGIVAALGCEKGAFRRGARAMMRPLKRDAPVPGYLGLVFD